MKWEKIKCSAGGLLTLAALIDLPVHAQTEYTLDGAPTALEEEFRWLINRGRFDSAAENLARGTEYSDIPASCGSLAPHASITSAARHHCEDMVMFNFLAHSSEESSYYTTGADFGTRMAVEGYTGAPRGEVIASSASASTASMIYLLWWNSSMGHRPLMYEASSREIGCGHAFDEPSGHRYTIDFGSRSAVSLFTGTLFDDGSADGEYDQGEGVSGIKVVISVGDVATGWYDISGDSGNFAIPISDVPQDTQAKVVLQNTNIDSVSLAIPVDYSTNNYMTLSGGETVGLGTFIRTSGSGNIGLRDLIANAPDPVARIWQAVEIEWASNPGTVYQVQWATALDTNQWHALGDPVVGNGETNSVYSRTTGTSQRFFRVIVP